VSTDPVGSSPSRPPDGWITNFGGAHVAKHSAKLTSALSQAQMNAIFTIHDNTSNTTAGTPTSIGFDTTGATVTVDTPSLTDGHQYSWSVQADDQYFDSSTSGTSSFIVDQTAPLDPTIASTDYPASGSGGTSTKTNGQTGTLNLHDPDRHQPGDGVAAREPRVTPTTVEEIVRAASPVTFMRRTVTRDLTLSGHDFHEGDRVVLFYGAANRDPRSPINGNDGFDVTSISRYTQH
jgi:hypothetical protein